MTASGVVDNIGVLVTCAGADRPQSIAGAALAFERGRIAWLGPQAELPQAYAALPRHDACGGLVTPGLIDCHTHLAFAGSRADELERRIRGEDYLAIARSGGGIASTLRATRAASEQDLVERAHATLSQVARLGVTTVECKSGYGLDLEQELKLLRVYRTLQAEQPLTLVPTFLGAHIVPPEYAGAREDYVRLLIERCLPAVAEEGLAEFCDVFVEDTAFTLAEARRILEAAAGRGLGLKLHADQFAAAGGAELAAELGAASADHLEHSSQAGREAMAAAGVVAVALPLASLYTFQKPFDARPWIAAGVGVAVSTDFNPGSAPNANLPQALSLACLLNRMTPEQALAGATRHAARAVGRERELGTLELGKAADLAVFDAPSVNTWLLEPREGRCRMTVKGGEVIHPGGAP